MPCFGQVSDGRPFWVGDFNGNGRADMLFYFPGDGNWWLGSHDGNQLQWSFAGNTNGFGQVWDGRPFWIGNFSRSDRQEVLFYFPGDGNWWLGSHDGNQLQWSFAGNTRYNSVVRLHLKVLNTPDIAINTMIESMREVYETACIRVDVGSNENLNLPELNDLDIGECRRGVTTAEQGQLFANRNNVGNNDIVVYFVRSTIPPTNGCAAHPAERPGAVVAQGATQWTLAHEVGHVLGLNHVDDNNRLMTRNGTGNITNPPPDLVNDEVRTMDTSPLTVNL
jgi:Matrixin